LIGQRRWLERADFLAACVLVDVAPDGVVRSAFIDWPALIEALQAGDLPCSGGERRVVLLALSLAEGVPVDLREALCALDRQALLLVAECVAHAGAEHEAVLTVGAAR
jgi:hypothetical protein